MSYLKDPKFLTIEIEENNEPIVDLINQNTIIYGPSPEISNNTDYTKMRKFVYEMLLQAQGLLPKGLKFCLYEAYRSLSLQNQLFNGRYNLIKSLNPGKSHKEIFFEAVLLVAPTANFDGTKTVPPHSTGGAVDVYLIDKNNNPVDMGIHPKDWMQDVDGSLSKTDSIHISREAQENRGIMSEVLTAVGFVNYPQEYWHWSYGDRMWAYYIGSAAALYGSV